MFKIRLKDKEEQVKKVQPKVAEPKKGIALVTAAFYKDISDAMTTLAIKTAHEQDVHIAKIYRVPGCFDVPFAVKKALQREDVKGVVALGAVIEGETDHDKIITHATAKTLQELSLHYNKPVSLGINGPAMSKEQAIARITRAKEATLACLSMLDL